MKQSETQEIEYHNCDSCGRRIRQAEYPDGSKSNFICPTCHRDFCKACEIVIITFHREENKIVPDDTLRGCKSCLKIVRKP
jgi:hypothetical protein